ncbi:MAG: hypothetical protein ACYTJ0_01880 [Planctomycetota bacterium]|jgi:tetratricopeptide (TPR) repeat protein
MLRFLVAALVLLIGSPLAAQEAAATIEAPESGFRLAIPDVGWAHREVRDGEGVNAVAVGPKAEGGLVQLAVQASPAAERGPGAAVEQARRLRASIESITGISEVEDLEIQIAGHAAHGLRLIQAAMGREFRVHLVFLVVNGFQYRIQFHAPREQFDEHWPVAQRVLEGFELIELDDAAREQVRLRGLANRCGSQVDWAVDWKDASERARRDRRPIVVAVCAQPGFSLGNALNESVFMSPEVVALMKHRFVGWRWRAGLEAPFVDHEVFGLSGSTFGVGLLVCDPDGQVVRQVFVIDPLLVADALRNVLRDHPELGPPPARATANAARQIAFLIDSGQLREALRLLAARGPDDSAALAYERARLSRIRRDGVAALRALDQARRAPDGPGPGAAALDLEEAIVRIGLGELDAADDAIERCLRAEPDARSRAEALLFRAVLSWARGHRDEAKARLLSLTRELPDEPAAWAAAARLLGPAIEIDVVPDLRWATDADAQTASLPAPAPAASLLQPASGLAGAIDWLLEHQREDGAWDIPLRNRDANPAPGQLELASQAICTMALARAADEWTAPGGARAARCREAARRGLQRYLEDRQLVQRNPRPVAFMDYACWGSSYGLFGLCVALETMPTDLHAAVRSEAAHLVEDLVRIQAANGGWSYYVSGEVGGRSSGAAMSFTTATVLLALHAAREQGLAVPDDVVDRGLACLALMRGTNGAWEYMRQGTQTNAAGAVGPAGAAARGPVCTLALQRGGRIEPTSMGSAVTMYVEHLGAFGAEARKALMHAGPAGQGSHYLLYDYSTAAEALRASGPDAVDIATRYRARRAILREMARCRSADGSFVDNPLIGSATGTGLAALTLLDLLMDARIPERRPVPAGAWW